MAAGKAQADFREVHLLAAASQSRSTLWSDRAARWIGDYLDSAGIQVDGSSPWDIQILDRRFFNRVLWDGTLGLGESYMDHWWDVERLDEFICRLEQAGVDNHFQRAELLRLWLADLIFNRQSRTRSEFVAERHYNLGNDVFEAMLDNTMQYTCAYWRNSTNLNQAQNDKLELIARKLCLQPDMTVLELGGGFGGLAFHLAANYGCRVVSYNNSEEQVRFGTERCRDLPVQFICADYREAAHLSRKFDRVVSVGLCEHVGHRNYRKFFLLMHSALQKRGLCLLHTIGANSSHRETDPWIDKYIFPNGMIPSIAQLGRAAEGLWVVEDWHNFGPDYDRTLMAWWENFDRAWPNLEHKYGERFYRMWKYYLLASAGTFRARRLQLWEVVLSSGDISSYVPVR